MALALSQPPETYPANLGQAARDPAILQAVQEELGNCLGGVITQRLQKCEDELTEQKALVAKLMEELATQQAAKDTAPDSWRAESSDLRKQLSKQKQLIRDMTEGLMGRMRRVYNGEELDWDDEIAEMDAAGKGSIDTKGTWKSRPSWNGMHSKDTPKRGGSQGEKMNQKEVDDMKLNMQQGGEGTGTDDLTVDRWGFRQSCWDAAAFIGDTDLLLPLEAMAVLFLVVLNICVQLCFTIIVMRSLVFSTVDQETQDDYHLWRTNTGHIIQFMDKNTMESLASRVCRGDGSLYLSDTQTTHVSDINRYLYDNEPFNGPMMAMLAIYVWILTVSKEFHVLKDMFVALRMVPHGETRVVKVKDRLVLQEIRLRRRCVILFLGFWRMLIAAAILVAGTMFLAVTIQISELLLNAIALEFILNVDELLYHAMAPMKTRRFLLLLKPLPLKKHKAWKGLDLSMFVVATFTFGAAGIVFAVFLNPEMDNMKATKAELCSGFLDFTYSPDKLGGMSWSPQVNDPDASIRLLLDSDRYKMIRRVIDNGANLGDCTIDPNVQCTNWTHLAIKAAPGADRETWSEHKMNREARSHMVSELLGPGWTVENVASWDVAAHVSRYNTMCTDSLSKQGKNAFPDSSLDMAESSIRDALARRNLHIMKAKCMTTFTATVKHSYNWPDMGEAVYNNLVAARICGCEDSLGDKVCYTSRSCVGNDNKWGKFVFYNTDKGPAAGESGGDEVPWVKMYLVHGGGDGIALWNLDNYTWPVRKFKAERCTVVNDQCIRDNWDTATIFQGPAGPQGDCTLDNWNSPSCPISKSNYKSENNWRTPYRVGFEMSGAWHDSAECQAASTGGVLWQGADVAVLSDSMVGAAGAKWLLAAGSRGKVVGGPFDSSTTVDVEVAKVGEAVNPHVRVSIANLNVVQAVDMWTDFQDLVDCRDLKPFCNDFYPPGVHVRFQCPVTCGCRDPNSTLALPWAGMGCSESCPGNPAFRKLLDVPCEENPAIKDTPHFKETIRNWRKAVDAFGGSAAATFNILADMLLLYGCTTITLVTDLYGLDVCSLPDLRPLHFMCPVTCNCISTPAPLCPSTCAALQGVPVEKEKVFCWTAGGVTAMIAMGKAGALGNPGAGDTISKTIMSVMKGQNAWDQLVSMKAVEECA